MTKNELHRAVAQATGEDLREIRRRGFSLLDEPSEPTDDVCLALDCPGCGTCVPIDLRFPAPVPLLAECDRCDAVYPFTPDELTVADRWVAVEPDTLVSRVA